MYAGGSEAEQRFAAVCYNHTGEGGVSGNEPYEQGIYPDLVTRTHSGPSLEFRPAATARPVKLDSGHISIIMIIIIMIYYFYFNIILHYII